MASSCRLCKIFGNARLPRYTSAGVRAFSVSAARLEGPSGEGFLSKLFVRKIEPTKESHSSLLGEKEVIYEMVTHQVKPAYLDKYIDNYEKTVSVTQSLKAGELMASWVVAIGDQDQVLHIWKYTGGYSGVDSARKILGNSTDNNKLLQERLTYLRKRHSQFILPFSYWPALGNRSGDNIYEIRSYILKPGTMIEWGNNWARAINFRQHNEEAFAGFFSQIGRLYNVHHIWCYKDLQARKETREAAWRKPGWDECVAYTVPLIREMDSRILYPTRFSPTK